MGFQIVWSDQAELQLDEIFKYYIENAGQRIAVNLVGKIIAEPNKLLKTPEISPREELLLDRESEYRYLVCKNYKIIYSIDEKAKLIKIADVFDSRQNPVKIKRAK